MMITTHLENDMSTPVTILGADRATLMNNTRRALEGFQKGRPVTRDALVRKALATILGQDNEHLPTADFSINNASLETRLRNAMAPLTFLQDWGTGDDEYLDLNFEARAWDTNAEKDDITVDYRISFHIPGKYAYFIICKNYGSGMVGAIEIPLSHLPYAPMLLLEGRRDAQWLDESEIFVGIEKMLDVYHAICADPLLKEVFIDNRPALSLKSAKDVVTTSHSEAR